MLFLASVNRVSAAFLLFAVATLLGGVRGNEEDDKAAEFTRIVRDITNRVDAMEAALTTPATPKDCSEVNVTGTTTIYVGSQPFLVYCDQSDGGGWTVFQRRINAGEDFYRTWDQYRYGFGNPGRSFWLGLEALHAFTSVGTYILRVDMVKTGGQWVHSIYNNFIIADDEDNYRLNYYTFNTKESTGGDSLKRHKGQQFTTRDRDNDPARDHNCAVEGHGAWWFEWCHDSDLNGRYYEAHRDAQDGITWYGADAYRSLSYTQMKVRPSRR